MIYVACILWAIIVVAYYLVKDSVNTDEQLKKLEERIKKLEEEQ